MSAIDDAPTLLMNQGIRVNHWILVKLEGKGRNREGVGARVKIKAGGQTQIREVKAGGSYASSSDLRAHFGLATSTVIEELSVFWPSGQQQILTNVPVDQIVKVRE